MRTARLPLPDKHGYPVKAGSQRSKGSDNSTVDSKSAVGGACCQGEQVRHFAPVLPSPSVDVSVPSGSNPDTASIGLGVFAPSAF